jgi:hypothetical protein
MVGRDIPLRQVARDFGGDESTLRYHPARPEDAPDSRTERVLVLDGWAVRIL